MDRNFLRLKNWILNSGLVISNQENENFGGVYSHYDLSTNEYGFIYPEITGYFLSTLRFLHQLNFDEKIIEKSKQSADWLIKIHNKYGGIIQGLSNDKSKQNLVYSFDTGICAKGMLDCYLVTKEQKYLNFAQKLLTWLIDDVMDSDGTLKPIKNLSTNQFETDNSVWYKQKGCLHVKTCMPFFQIYQITKISKYLECGRLICKTYKKFQKNDGSLSIHHNSKIIHMHTLCYALEGLLYAYEKTKNEDLLLDCKKTLDWCVTKIQDGDGSTNLWFNSRYKQAKTSYHIAQLIRLMNIVNKNFNIYDKFISKLYSFLISMQEESSDIKSNGGLHEDISKSIFGWKKNSKINSWGSMFALQAFYWKEHPKNNFNYMIDMMY